MEKTNAEEGIHRLDRRQNGQGSIDIFSMLSKAQETFNKTPTKQDSVPVSSTPRVPDVTSKSVMDFFAKASTNNTTQKTPASSENVLHRLMSNPAHSVEHIEKQQRSVTPQEHCSGIRIEADGTNRRSVPINIPGTSGTHVPLDNFEINGPNVSHVSPSNQNVSCSPLAFLMQQNQPKALPNESLQHSVSMFDNNNKDNIYKLLKGKQSVESQQSDKSANNSLSSKELLKFFDNRPLLMTPMMFTSPNVSKEKSPAKMEPVEMLTEKQLAQALIYLLKNNEDFIKQIHQAYTNSILEKVDKSKDAGDL